MLLARLLAPRIAPLLAAMCQSYSAAALARPLLTKSATSAVAYFLGDSISQWAAGSSRPLDRGRVARATLAGAISHGPQLHYWSLLLDRYVDFGGPPWLRLLAKIALDQTLFSLYLNAAYCALTEMLQGRPVHLTVRKVRAAAWPCLRAGWRFWPAAHALTYSVVPAHLRVLWVDVLEVAWVAILASCVSKSGGGHAPAEEKAAGGGRGEGAVAEGTDAVEMRDAGGVESGVPGVHQNQLAL